MSSVRRMVTQNVHVIEYNHDYFQSQYPYVVVCLQNALLNCSLVDIPSKYYDNIVRILTSIYQ